mgnify:CR=1 FL=1
MKILFYLAGFLLTLAGLMHLVLVFTTPYDPTALLPTAAAVLFGAADIVIGVMLVRGIDRVLPYAVAVPLVGGLLVLMRMAANPSPWNTVFLVVDAFVIAISLFLLRAGRPVISRVK